MAILNGELADADEVMNAFGLQFKNLMQTYYDSLYNGWHATLHVAGVPNSENLFYTVHNNSDMTITDDMFYNSTSANEKYLGPLLEAEADGSFATIDEHNDNAVDAGIWDTVGTVTEANNEYMSVVDTSDGGGSSTATTDHDVRTEYSRYLRIKIRANHTGSNGNSDIRVGEVTVYTPPNDNTYYVVDVLIGPDNEVFEYDTEDTTWTGKGTCNVNGLLKYTANNTGHNQRIDIDFTRYWDFTGTPGTVPSITLTSAQTASATATNCIMTYNWRGDEPQAQVSADNGANYENVSDATIHRFTNTGTQIKTKFTWPGVIADSFAIYEHAVCWNWY